MIVLIFVRGSLVKLGVAVAAAIIIIAVVAALLSGFMTAFKPGNNTTSSTTSYSGGASGGGVSSVATMPSPSPVPDYGGPAELPAQAIPGESMQVPAGTLVGPGLDQTPMQNLQTPYVGGTMPVQQPDTAAGEGSASLQYPGMPPAGYIGGQVEPGFSMSPSASATPVATPAPAATPGPVIMPPISGPETPEAPASSAAPGEYPYWGSYENGWRQVILRLLEVLPLMFPGYFPGLQWYEIPSAC